MGKVASLNEENTELRQQQAEQFPDLEAVSVRILSDLRVGKQSPEYKRTKATIDRFINEMRTGLPNQSS